MAEAARVHSFRVGPWTATVSVPLLRRSAVQTAVCEWEPAVPDRSLTRTEQAQYERGLSEALAAASNPRR